MAATTRTRVILAIALAALVVGGWFIYELIDTDAPDAVSTDAALSQLEADNDAGESSVFDGAAIGTWTVDDDFGEFSFSNASGSFAGFRVAKAFFSGQGATAVGRSGSVTGEIVIGDGELSAAEIVVDMTQMESDERARVSAIKDAINVADHPSGTFVLAAPVTLDTDALAAGETATVDATGSLTIAGVTNEVTIPIDATITDDGVGIIIGSAELVWADYGVATPESSIADVADEGTLEFQLIVRPN